MINESLVRAIAALGDKVEDLKRDIDIRDFRIGKLEKELEEKSRELEELKSEKIRKALED